MQRSEIDDLDRTVIAMLTEDGRLSASEIASRIGSVSERTIRNRISSLLQNRHITIGAIPDPTSGGREVQADVSIQVEPGRTDEVARLLGEHDEIFYLAAISGDYSLSASVFVTDHSELHEFCERVIGKIPGVKRVVLHPILRLYKIFGTRTTALNRAVPKTRKAE
jgi:DNA-binding Lrp family transcriptional regulator